ncbi:hypothetical protein DFP78_10314 [Photobacterium lutimaris]|nr:hypothetical protein DFP78_10314 [Photobacterium lutimaris]
MNYFNCPSCKKLVHFHRIHRGRFERLIKKKYAKFQCSNCSSIVLSHTSMVDVHLIKNGEKEPEL